MDELQPLNQRPQDNQENKTDLHARTRLGLLIIGLFVLVLGVKSCGKKKIEDSKPGETIKINHPGKLLGVGTKRTGEPPSKLVEKYIPPEGSITITPKDSTKSIDDLVRIQYKEIGFTFEPGLECSGNLYYSCGFDSKVFYAYRFGLGAGVVGGNNVISIISPCVFVSYRLDRIHFRNTEAIITYVPLSKIPFGLGIRINL